MRRDEREGEGEIDRRGDRDAEEDEECGSTQVAAASIFSPPWALPVRSSPGKGSPIRGNNLSHTTCLTHVFFKSDESFSKLW